MDDFRTSWRVGRQAVQRIEARLPRRTCRRRHRRGGRLPRRACPPAAGEAVARTPALHRRRVASVGLHHGDGLAKLSWGSVSVTLRPLVPAEISTLGLAPPVRPSKSSGVVARLPRWPILARLKAAT